MRTLFYILGTLAVLLGCIWLLLGRLARQDVWVCGFGGGAFIASGATLIIAAVKHYRGHWSLVVGLALLSASLFFLGSEIQDALAHGADHLVDGIWIISPTFVLGVLSLLSSHRLHRSTVALEAMK